LQDFAIDVNGVAVEYGPIRSNDTAVPARPLTNSHPSATLRPTNFGAVLAPLFIGEMVQQSNEEFEPQLTVELIKPSQKLPTHTIQIAYHSPEDPGGFLQELNARLRAELRVLRLDEAPNIDPKRDKNKNNGEPDFVTPPARVPLTHIDIPVSLDISSLTSMKHSLKVWLDRTTHRAQVELNRPEQTAEVFKTYKAEVDSLRSSLERYIRLVDDATNLTRAIRNARLISGRVTYVAIDPNDPSFMASIPVFEVSTSYEE
jgi:hypothetical protein